MAEDKKSASVKKEKKKDAVYEISEMGSIRVDDEVIASIAAYTALAIEGVASMVGGFSEMFGKRSASKGVKLDYTSEGLVIELHILVHYGVPIPDLAHHVQREVSAHIKDMTGIDVQRIHVVVQGMQFPADASASKEDLHD